MKARVKATGEIVEVREEYDLREAMVQVYYSLEEDPYVVYEKEELDFNVKEKSFPKDDPDYWTRLEHTYAGMAMQGFCVNPDYRDTPWDRIAEDAIRAARTLAQKLKKEERK